MVDVPASPVKDPILVAVRTRLEHSHRIIPTTPRHRTLVIVRFGWSFELAISRVCHFDCLLNLLWVFLMCMRERYRLCYC